MTKTGLILACVAASLYYLISRGAEAHDASAGWTYPPACCKGTELDGDCHSIPDARVTERRHGYAIRLYPGDHPSVTRRHVFVVPYGDEIPSGDGEFHVCLYPKEDMLNCFFAPPPGT